jgi:hypothetical protein
MAEWLARLLHILEVLGSNLSLEASYPDRFLVVILSLLKKMLR